MGDGNTPDRGTPLVPIVISDLSRACSDLSSLVGAAYHWLPEEEWNALAEEIRPHLLAMAESIRRGIANHRQQIKWEPGRLEEFVYIELASLREYLKGRRVGVNAYCQVPPEVYEALRDPQLRSILDDLCERPFGGGGK